MKKKEMKKVLPAILAVVLVFGVGLAMAGYSGQQGVPAAKCAVGENVVSTSELATNDWVTYSTAVIKTENKADLIISFTAECALATDVEIKGKGKEVTSESMAQIKVRALVDDVPTKQGNVTFASRKMILTGLLWAPENFDRIEDSDGLLALPEQYIEIYEETCSANGFNFVKENVECGVHEITIEIMTDAGTDVTGGEAWAVIGPRTLIVESVKMAN